jgi:thiamine phosphate synthase YjbQ (UPF0047 family)
METETRNYRTGDQEAVLDLTHDAAAYVGDLLPTDDRWRHRHGSPGHGRSHVMPAFVPPYATIPVVGGKLLLGTWQSLGLVDLNVDNPVREVRFSFVMG